MVYVARPRWNANLYLGLFGLGNSLIASRGGRGKLGEIVTNHAPARQK